MGLAATVLGIVLLLFGIKSVFVVYGIIAVAVSLIVMVMFLGISGSVLDVVLSVAIGLVAGMFVYAVGMWAFSAAVPIISGIINNDVVVYLLGLFVTDIAVPVIVGSVLFLVRLLFLPFSGY